MVGGHVLEELRQCDAGTRLNRGLIKCNRTSTSRSKYIKKNFSICCVLSHVSKGKMNYLVSDIGTTGKTSRKKLI